MVGSAAAADHGTLGARADIAYRFANDVAKGGWVLVLGTGFAFERAR